VLLQAVDVKPEVCVVLKTLDVVIFPLDDAIVEEVVFSALDVENVELVVLGMMDELVVVSFFSGIFVFIPTLKMTSEDTLPAPDTMSSSSVRTEASKEMAEGVPVAGVTVWISMFSRTFRSTQLRPSVPRTMVIVKFRCSPAEAV